eukprot:CAMPEP_0194385284 /NCGR_PEP_ID=MMETSP0174-20130528/79253_1 /TAXON_ID=216777 /ORGANISM="Proboscia alata, Strain PI-D3" /LENGTH=94 /DNA_ID=CAMNT_0039173239 /DNA_START=187 /DNA_END=467 /DNA_ORIENTATION=+
MRLKMWSRCDANGNGIVSLAEVDSWVRGHLCDKLANQHGEELWLQFRPCYKNAFIRATNIATTKVVRSTGDATSDDYVTQQEFRILLSYLCIYA